MPKPNEERILKKTLKVVSASPTFRRILPPPWYVDFAWVSRPEMAKLNGRFRGKRRPTDVLSFPAPDVFVAEGFLGGIAICSPVMRAQAKEHGLTEDMETQILILHGLLHLLGADHERSKKEARGMARWERRFLKELCPASWVKRSKGRCLRGMIEP